MGILIQQIEPFVRYLYITFVGILAVQMEMVHPVGTHLIVFDRVLVEARVEKTRTDPLLEVFTLLRIARELNLNSLASRRMVANKPGSAGRPVGFRLVELRKIAVDGLSEFSAGLLRIGERLSTLCRQDIRLGSKFVQVCCVVES